MYSKHKLLALLCLLFFITGIIKAQTFNANDPKWDQTPNTALYPLGNYTPLPQQVLPVPRSMVPRVIKTPNEVLVVSPNIQVLPSPGVLQIETPIVASRVNPSFMFGSANIIQSGQINAGSYHTTDGGLTWSGANFINNGNTTNQRSDPGPAIDKNQRIIFTHITSSSNFGSITGMGAEWSTNFGVNFSPTVQIENNGNVDKNLAGTDDNPGSPFYGNTYCAYTVFSGSNGNGHFNRTTDGGLTWGTAYQISVTPSPYFAQGHDVDVMPNGNVVVCWTLGQQTSPYTEHFVGVARSTDGGVTINPANVLDEAYAVNGTRSFAFNGWSGFRINGFPRISIDKSGGPRNGWIYIVDDQVNLAPAGSDADVIMHRSTDGGATWSAGIRVNQDALNNGKVQFFPCVNVDATGGVNVAYYDNRNFPSVGDSASVFISRSVDGGNTWTDLEVADHHYIPKQPPGVGGGFDYIGVTSANGKIWAFWSDDKSGTFNAWAGYLIIGPSISHTPLPNTENLTGPYVVNSVITPAGSPIDPTKTKLLWSRNNPSITDSLLLTNTSGNNWTGNIPGNGSPATYRYYLKTADLLGRVATAPPGAPGNLYSFIASPDTVKPVIVHSPITTWPKISWPASITANITDNIGVDSGWVEWYKNTPSVIKEFKLLPTGGGNYSAPFNSVNADVNVGDSVFYVIKARDISSNHNLAQLPVSGYFKIMIVQSYPLPPYCRCDDITYTPITGTAGPSGDDVTLTVPVGFTFHFMGHDVTQASICTNGFVILGSSTFNGYTNGLCTTTGTANPMLAPFWDDLNTLNGGNIVYTTLGSAPNRIFVVQFTNVAYFNGSGNVTFQLRLYEDPGAATGNIEFIYGPATNNPSSSGSVGETDTLGGSNHLYSITPGATCGTTTFSQTSCNDAVAYNFPSGRRYTFNCLVGINPISQGGIPREFKLTQNYPNPFNPTTMIKFSIPKTSLVRLIVYDVLGREVKTLLSEQKMPGNYDISFDGSALASGVYFYKLEAGTFTDVKKMVLIK